MIEFSNRRGVLRRKRGRECGDCGDDRERRRRKLFAHVVLPLREKCGRIGVHLLQPSIAHLAHRSAHATDDARNVERRGHVVRVRS